MELSDFLSKIGAFRHFNEDLLKRLAACAWRQSFDEGAYIFRKGDSSREPFAILNGSVQLRINSDAGEFTLGVISPGFLFGEANYIDQKGRSGDAVASENCELLLFDADRLAAVAEGDTAFEAALLWAFWHSLSQKLRRANSQLSEFFSDRGVVAPPIDVPAIPHKSEDGLDLESRRQVFLEQRLSPMEIHFLASLSEEERFRTGEVIFREGDQGDKMFVVLEGRVMITKNVDGAGEEALDFLERGEYFGEMALIDDEPRSASAKAHDEGALVLSIAREVVEGLLKIDNVASTRLLNILCGLGATRLRAVDEKMIGWYLLSQPGTDQIDRMS